MVHLQKFQEVLYFHKKKSFAVVYIFTSSLGYLFTGWGQSLTLKPMDLCLDPDEPEDRVKQKKIMK